MISVILTAGVLLLAGAAGAQSLKNLTLPPYHWATDYALEWQLRAVQKPLYAASLPWQFSQVYDAVSNRAPRSDYERFLRLRLMNDQRAYGLKTHNGQPFLHFGALLVEKAGRMADELRSRLAFRFFSAARVSEHVQIFNSMMMDQSLGDDPDYLGKNWRGITAITEQAYALVHFDRFSLKFGRDYIRWGRGYDATLSISDASRPFDQLHMQFRTRYLQFSYFVSKLNSIQLSDTAAQRLQKAWADRYLAGGRADFAFFQRRLQVSITQTVLWGGDRNLEWYYLNPFIFYHGEQLNEPQSLRANTMGAIDFVFYPKPGWELYGQLLVDDIQVEKNRPR
ncbi:MAG: capsule assembly Wzi family protein [candidate division KSB1 bacterium]|nr:capsule assembly Wzi family protein [candidate division KSB1 bacterium]